MKKLRIAILGYGYWGPNLARNFSQTPDCELAAIADYDPERLASAKRSYPAVEAVSDGAQILGCEEIDAFVIATPPSTHYRLAKTALNNGKHVLIEKPIAENPKEAETLLALAKANGLTLMVDHTFIYSGAVRKIREIVDSGELGEILYVDSVRINLGIFQNDVGVMEDLAPHDLSIVDYLVEAIPETVSAIGIAPISYRDRTPESLVYATIQFNSGLLAHFHLSWLSPVKMRRMLIGGSKKTVIYDHLDPDNQVKVYEKGLDIVNEGERRKLLGERRIGDLYAPKVDQTEPLKRVCQHFVECALYGKAAMTDGDAGLRVVRLLEAFRRSIDRGGAVVSV